MAPGANPATANAAPTGSAACPSGSAHPSAPQFVTVAPARAGAWFAVNDSGTAAPNTLAGFDEAFEPDLRLRETYRRRTLARNPMAAVNRAVFARLVLIGELRCRGPVEPGRGRDWRGVDCRKSHNGQATNRRE